MIATKEQALFNDLRRESSYTYLKHTISDFLAQQGSGSESDRTITELAITELEFALQSLREVQA